MGESAVEKPGEITCQQCRDLLSSYVDRELSPDERTSVEHHVRTCTQCAQETTCVKGLKNLVENWDGVKSDNKFRERVMQEFIRESQLTASAPFTEAADKAREESVRHTVSKGAFSMKVLWGIVLGMALGAAVLYFVIQWLNRQ